MSVFLNAPAAQRRIVAWASAFIECDVDCEFDASSHNTDALHFIIVPRNADDELVLSSAAARTFSSLGPAFDLQHESESNELHIYVNQPDKAQADELLRAFRKIASVVERSTWPFAVSGVMILVGVALFCYAFSGLHTHLHQYEAPWETFFEWAFSLPILVGDTLRAAAWADKPNVGD